MDMGLIHIYCGNGKGKTTAAMGLGMRAAGREKKVLLTQFLKRILKNAIYIVNNFISLFLKFKNSF